MMTLSVTMMSVPCQRVSYLFDILSAQPASQIEQLAHYVKEVRGTYMRSSALNSNCASSPTPRPLFASAAFAASTRSASRSFSFFVSTLLTITLAAAVSFPAPSVAGAMTSTFEILDVGMMW